MTGLLCSMSSSILLQTSDTPERSIMPLNWSSRSEEFRRKASAKSRTPSGPTRFILRSRSSSAQFAQRALAKLRAPAFPMVHRLRFNARVFNAQFWASPVARCCTPLSLNLFELKTSTRIVLFVARASARCSAPTSPMPLPDKSRFWSARFSRKPLPRYPAPSLPTPFLAKPSVCNIRFSRRAFPMCCAPVSPIQLLWTTTSRRVWFSRKAFASIAPPLHVRQHPVKRNTCNERFMRRATPKCLATSSPASVSSLARTERRCNVVSVASHLPKSFACSARFASSIRLSFPVDAACSARSCHVSVLNQRMTTDVRHSKKNST
mmetsp:Transcript_103617/g.292454  ORF Transcript_103617/g.292454 Transcript_103617/m.292454 type:complete len:321 (-) Transcript_103617:15-977(-)